MFVDTRFVGNIDVSVAFLCVAIWEKFVTLIFIVKYLISEVCQVFSIITLFSFNALEKTIF